MARVVGTAGDDNLVGTDGFDVLIGGRGDDRIDAGAGNDVIRTGTGDDLVITGGGQDFIFVRGTGDKLIVDIDAAGDGFNDAISVQGFGAAADNNVVVEEVAGSAQVTITSERDPNKVLTLSFEDVSVEEFEEGGAIFFDDGIEGLTDDLIPGPSL